MSRWRTKQSIPNDTTSPGPKVLACGLWRCATSSLQDAFEKHLVPPLKPSMHGSYLFTSSTLIKTIPPLLLEPSKQKRQETLRETFTGYNASSDFPGIAFIDDLVELYPSMKLILNKRRNAETWETSVNQSLRFFSTWTYFALTCLVPQSYRHWKAYRDYEVLARRRFGSDVDIWSARYYDLHNEWVRGIAKKYDRPLLEWEPDDGWEPLCEFLEVDVPGVEFPRTNEAAEIREGKYLLIARGVVVWLLVLGVAWFVVRMTRSWLV